MSAKPESVTANWITPDKDDYARSILEPSFRGLQIIDTPQISEAFVEAMTPVIWKIRETLDNAEEIPSNWLMFDAIYEDVTKLATRQRKALMKKFDIPPSSFAKSTQRMTFAYAAIIENKPVEEIMKREEHFAQERYKIRNTSLSSYDRPRQPRIRK